jgi:hypothetical protein
MKENKYLTEVDLSIQSNEHQNQTRSKKIALKREIKHHIKIENETMSQSDKYIANKKTQNNLVEKKNKKQNIIYVKITYLY